MIEFRLKFVRGSQGKLMLCLDYLPRFIYLFILMLVIGAMVVTSSISFLGSLFSLILLFGVIFEDSWTWDPETKVLVHRSGTLIIAKKRYYKPQEIGSFEVRRFTRGRVASGTKSLQTRTKSGRPPRGGSHMISLGFDHSKDGFVIMENHKARATDDLTMAAEAFAAAMAKTCSSVNE